MAARDSAGRSIDWNREDAICFCLLGALCRSKGWKMDGPVDIINLMHESPEYKLLMEKTGGVTQWNDHPLRTFEEVKALVEELDI